MTSANIVIADC